MSIRVYTPEEIDPPKTGVVYYNQLGASAHEDAGRDAMYLAEALGVTVMAVDRPGSSYSLPVHGKSLQRDYIAAIAEQGNVIASEAEKQGLDHLVASGRSAGGLAALALTCTETAPIAGITAKEPVGMYRTTVQDGRKDYTAYLKRQKTAQEEARASNSELVLPEPTELTGIAVARRALSIAYCAVADQLNNRKVWAQPLARDAARYIARNMPHVRTEMLFADDSMVASRDQIDSLASEVRALRENAPLDGQDRQPFTVSTLPNTTHASFDLRSFYQRQDQRFLTELETQSGD